MGKIVPKYAGRCTYYEDQEQQTYTGRTVLCVCGINVWCHARFGLFLGTILFAGYCHILGESTRYTGKWSLSSSSPFGGRQASTGIIVEISVEKEK
jgi:hypothetical protein